MLPFPPPITSRTNARVKAARQAFRGRASEPGELVGIEGLNLLGEAMRSGLQVESVLVREGAESQVPSMGGVTTARVLVLSEDVFASVVDTASPQGIAAVVAIPAPVAVTVGRGTGAVLVLEDIQDPGNMGTLLRSAEAFGVEQVYLTPGCANPWSPKAVRASAGSVFRARLQRLPIGEALAALRRDGVRSLGAVAQGGKAVAAPEALLTSPVAVVVGNEGAGLSLAALEHVDGCVHIPCAIESLNAAIAGSVLLYEVQRQTHAQRNEGTA